jgi:hypothetical protein
MGVSDSLRLALASVGSLSRQRRRSLFARCARQLPHVLRLRHRAVLCRCKRPVVLGPHSACGFDVVWVVVGRVGAICAIGLAVSYTSSAGFEFIGAKGVRTVALAQMAGSVAFVGE